MHKLFFMRRVLEMLGQAPFFYRALGIVLRSVAALVVLFSLTTFFQAGKLIFELPANGILGGVLFEVLFVIAVYATVHVLLIRARDLEALPPGERFVLRAAPLLMRMLGEVYASFVSLVGIGAGVFVWFTGLPQTRVLNPFVASLFPTMRENPSFMGGIEFMLSGVLIAVAVLIVCYALAEAGAMLLQRPREPVVQHANGRHNGDHRDTQIYRSRLGG